MKKLLFIMLGILLLGCSTVKKESQETKKVGIKKAEIEAEIVKKEEVKQVQAKKRKKKVVEKFESLTLIPKDYVEEIIELDENVQIEGAKIERIHPLRVKPGTLVSIVGDGFGEKAGIIKLGESKITKVLEWGNNVIWFRVPETVKSGDRIKIGDSVSNGAMEIAGEDSIKMVWEIDIKFAQDVIDANAYNYDLDVSPKLVPPFYVKGQWTKSPEFFGDYDSGWSGGGVPLYNVKGTSIWKHEIYFTNKNFERFKKKIVYFAIEDSNNEDFGLSAFESNPALIIKKEWGKADDIKDSDNDPGFKMSTFSKYYIEKENTVYAVFPMPNYVIHDRVKAEAEKVYLDYDLSNLEIKQDGDSFSLKWEANDIKESDKINIYSKIMGRAKELVLTLDSKKREAVIKVKPFKPATISIKIENEDGIESRGLVSEKYTSKLKNVVIDKYATKDIHVYLPNGYETSKKDYKVMYMFDGQNLFSDAYVDNEWKIDEVLEKLTKEGKIEDIIVVGIFNAGRQRHMEYIPYFYNMGVEYGETLTKEIIPYIESKYRVKTGRENRGIAGSSLGGLMALYMHNNYADEFSFYGAFSTHDPWGLEKLKEAKKSDSIVWVDAGTSEYATNSTEDGREEFYSYVDQARTITDTLMEKGYELGKNLYYFEVKDAIHNEIDWSQRVYNIFLLFNGKNKAKVIDMRLDIEEITKNDNTVVKIVNPIIIYDTGLEHSMYKKGNYSIIGGTINQKGEFTVEEDEAIITVKFEDIEKKIKVIK